MKHLKLIVVLAVTLIFCTLSMAQPAPPSPEEMDALANDIQTLMISRMKQRLDLTSDQTAKIMDIMDKKQESRKALMEEGRKLREELKALLDNPETSDRDYLNIVAKFEDHRNKMEKTEKNSMKDIKSVLNPKQQAQAIIFMQRFQKRMKQRLHQRQGEGLGKGAGRNNMGFGGQNRPDCPVR